MTPSTNRPTKTRQRIFASTVLAADASVLFLGRMITTDGGFDSRIIVLQIVLDAVAVVAVLARKPKLRLGAAALTASASAGLASALGRVPFSPDYAPQLLTTLIKFALVARWACHSKTGDQTSTKTR
jgi:hypothetical protein